MTSTAGHCPPSVVRHEGEDENDQRSDDVGLEQAGEEPLEGAQRSWILDPDPDDVLVAVTTDPSWITLFLTAGALVVDVGGALSHAAIIARELGIPCVIGTGDGTSRIAPGVRVRVDGTAGTVEIVE